MLNRGPAGNLAPSFSLNFLSILGIFEVPMSQSLWTRHHWKALFLLQKLSIDDAKFGQKWWRQKWKKGQGSSRAVTGGTGVNGLMHKHFIQLVRLDPYLFGWLAMWQKYFFSSKYHTKKKINYLRIQRFKRLIHWFHFHVRALFSYQIPLWTKAFNLYFGDGRNNVAHLHQQNSTSNPDKGSF